MLVIKKKVIKQRSKLLCNHKYSRGINQGKFCNEAAMIGYKYCKTHFNKHKHVAMLINKLEKCLGNLLDIELVKNEFGEYEDQYTGFIFSLESQKVLGKRSSNREIEKLNIYDIALIMKKGWEIYSDDNSDSDI